MARRKVLWIAIPVAALAAIAALSLFAMGEKADPSFDFLTKLHPLLGPFRPTASTYLITGGHLAEGPAPTERVLVFPAARATEIDQLVTSRFAPESGSMIEFSSSTVNGVAISHDGKQSIHSDGNGRQVMVITGQYVEGYLGILRPQKIPPDSCLVVTITPATGTEVIVGKVLHFLHLR